MLNIRITMVWFVEISTEVFSVNSEKKLDILTDAQHAMGTIPWQTVDWKCKVQLDSVHAQIYIDI